MPFLRGARGWARAAARRLAVVLLALAGVQVGAFGDAGVPASGWFAEPSRNRAASADAAFTTTTHPHAKSDSVFAMAVLTETGAAQGGGWWTFMFGMFGYDSLLIDQWGVYAIVVEPDGTAHWFRQELQRADVAFAATHLDVRAAANRVSGVAGAYHITGNFDGLGFDLTYTNLLEPWMAGDGVEPLSRNGTAFQKVAVFSPWARVSGTLDVRGRRVAVSGQGMAEKSLMVMPLSRFHPEIISMRVFSLPFDQDNAGLHVGLLDATTHPAYGSRRVGRLFVVRDGQWLFATPLHDVQLASYRHSAEPPFSYPHELRLRAAGAGYTLEGTYRSTGLFDVTDVLAELPPWLRGLVLLFVRRPVYFRHRGELIGTLTHPDGRREPLHLFGPYEYVAVQ